MLLFFCCNGPHLISSVRMSAISELKRAKEHSDKRQYGAKHQIIKKMMTDDPDAFFIDSDDGKGIVGVTHKRTGFRFHMPTGKVRPGLSKTAAEDKPVDWTSAAAAGGEMYAANRFATSGLARALGAQRYQHGTSDAFAKQILDDGLLASHGGKAGGGADKIRSPRFVANSKNYIHVADDSLLGGVIARLHASFTETPNPTSKSHLGHILAGALGKGTIIRGVMPYDTFHNEFKPDSDHLPGAFKSTTSIAPDNLSRLRPGILDIVRNKAKDLPAYLSQHSLGNEMQRLGDGMVGQRLAGESPKLRGLLSAAMIPFRGRGAVGGGIAALAGGALGVDALRRGYNAAQGGGK